MCFIDMLYFEIKLCFFENGSLPHECHFHIPWISEDIWSLMERWRLNTVTVKQQLCALPRVPANLDRLAELGITPELSGIFLCVSLYFRH